jgi:3',5'-cyclic AMP phosphodiesterase CpdA
MLIAQISDTHILARGDDHPAADLRADCLARVVADINEQRPDVVLFTGDTVQHGRPDEYARLRALLDPLIAPLYLVPGNRDDNDALRKAFTDFDYLPKEGAFLHYAVDIHPVRFIALDSTAPEERKGRYCADRQEWLEAMLATEPERPTMLFIHHPPFDVDNHYVGGYRRLDEAAALTEIVSRHAPIAGLLCGHVHWLVEREWAGTQARIMPSVAVDVRKGVDETEAQHRPIYWLHTLDGEHGLVSRARMTPA